MMITVWSLRMHPGTRYAGGAGERLRGPPDLHDLLAPARRVPRHRRRTAPHYLVASRCTNRSDTPHAAAIDSWDR